MRNALQLALSLLLVTVAPARADEPVIGGPCEGCEAVFLGMPDEIGWSTRLAPPGEPGQRMVIEGVVRGPDGEPAEGVVVYAYQTDAGGVYPEHPELDGWADRHGRLRGWARTGDDGRYRFETIRPGSYPGTTVPAHVHMHVIEPGCCTYYIDDIHFGDDPLLSAAQRDRMARGRRGGSGLVAPETIEGGAIRVERDILLGEGIPDHPGRGDSPR